MHEIYLRISENRTRELEQRLQRRLAAEERGGSGRPVRRRARLHLPLHRTVGPRG